MLRIPPEHMENSRTQKTPKSFFAGPSEGTKVVLPFCLAQSDDAFFGVWNNTVSADDVTAIG